MSDNKESKQTTSQVEKVVNEIIDELIRGELHPGDRLLTEPELSKKYGVGRNSVREAIKELQAFGVLYIKRADGTYVEDSYSPKLLDPMLYSLILHSHEWDQFVQLRSVIDIGTLFVALENPEVQDIVPKLNDILASINEEVHNEQPDIDKLLDEDLKFHQEITKTIHNSQIETVNDYIVRISIPSRRESIQKWLRDGKQDTFVDLHRQIIDVIEKRDTERIVEVIKDHYVYWK
ncbi:MAG: FadR family transcriptional regulator [Lachnospiraceae bacterium]|jgi:DNA-binding FadR family transcriptional regulator|nr:FadR family transcriptional regulator [Lachnospiraceae bacterium]